MSARVILYTRRQCGLCDDVAAALIRLQAALGYAYDEVDIDGDAALSARYGEAIPVVTVDDREIARAPVDPARLERELRRALRG